MSLKALEDIIYEQLYTSSCCKHHQLLGGLASAGRWFGMKVVGSLWISSLARCCNTCQQLKAQLLKPSILIEGSPDRQLRKHRNIQAIRCPPRVKFCILSNCLCMGAPCRKPTRKWAFRTSTSLTRWGPRILGPRCSMVGPTKANHPGDAVPEQRRMPSSRGRPRVQGGRVSMLQTKNASAVDTVDQSGEL